tara:strand:+ start:751 stop:1494 length:744 start_codon:yes stop_codon:yes gene_type:complete
MFERIIEFSASETYLKNYSDKPEPIKLNIPQWFKDLEHHPRYKTIKGCQPFLETLTSGYLLRTPIDYHLLFNQETKEDIQGSKFTSNITTDINKTLAARMNIGETESHSIDQLSEKCPFNHRNKGYSYIKILNPWTIKTPPGYSCLFLPPLNNSDDRFSIIPGIVDTDTFTAEINFPIIINGDKYEKLDTIIKQGTPYVQVIPFKRDSWKMKIISKKNNENLENRFLAIRSVLHSYKNSFWKKRTWK